ncbi:MAG: hypothetical protein J6Q14_08125 [Oscillospiraceae bacterium]|nr:hypothetical protein [Oscillospiraceae bacterium]
MRKITVTLSEREQSIIREALTRYIIEAGKAREIFIIFDEAWLGATRDYLDELQVLYKKIVKA